MKRFALGLAAIVSGYWLLLFLFQRALLFPAPRLAAGVAHPTDGLQVWLPVPFGRVEARYLPPGSPDTAPGPVILFAHGNGEVIDLWADAFAPVRAWGFGVLLVEYPGYGRSDGSPTRETIRQTFEAAHAWLVAQPTIDPRRMVYYGRSLGTGAVADLSLAHPPAAMVLESGFSRLSAFAGRFLAPPFLIRDRFDNLAALAQYHGPTLVLHGDHDEVIPTAQGRELAAAAGGPLVLLACGHNDCPRPWPEIRNFLQQSGLLARDGRPGH